MSEQKIIVLREGTRIDKFEDGVKISRAICSSIVLIKGEGHNIIVDPGARGYGGELLQSLGKNGLTPSDIDLIVNTHGHLDHCFNNFLFDEATIYSSSGIWPSQKDETHIYGDITRATIPCVKLINTPGHTTKHVSVVAESDGKTIVVAGDAIRESIIEEGALPDKYVNKQAYLESMKKIFEIADVIIPGHGKVIEGAHLTKLKQKLDDMK
ncbi:MAG: MBL fold metallo-hydrolase [Methanobacteriota archaeon]